MKDTYYVLVMLSGAASADIGSSIIVFAKRLGFQVSTFFAKIHVKTAATASEVVVV